MKKINRIKISYNIIMRLYTIVNPDGTTHGRFCGNFPHYVIIKVFNKHFRNCDEATITIQEIGVLAKNLSHTFLVKRIPIDPPQIKQCGKATITIRHAVKVVRIPKTPPTTLHN